MPHSYTGPGLYVAVCNNSRFDGHYIKVFEVPDTEETKDVEAGWYFLNRLDFFACLEAVYSLSVFAPLMTATLEATQATLKVYGK